MMPEPNGWLERYLASIQDKLKDLDSQMSARFDRMDARLESVDQRLHAIETARAVQAKLWEHLRLWGVLVLTAAGVLWGIGVALWHW